MPGRHRIRIKDKVKCIVKGWGARFGFGTFNYKLKIYCKNKMYNKWTFIINVHSINKIKSYSKNYKKMFGQTKDILNARLKALKNIKVDKN